MRRIHVVAAIVRRDGRYLICRRPPGGHLPLLWEFPGGKVEADEDEPGCLVRELREELGVRAVPGRLVDRTVHRYESEGLEVELAFWSADIGTAEPQLLSHQDMRWVRPDELDAYAFPEADEAILDRLRREG